jgi:hypothetical protein
MGSSTKHAGFIIIQNYSEIGKFYSLNAVLSGKLQLAKIGEARTKSQL